MDFKAAALKNIIQVFPQEAMATEDEYGFFHFKMGDFAGFTNRLLLQLSLARCLRPKGRSVWVERLVLR